MKKPFVTAMFFKFSRPSRIALLAPLALAFIASANAQPITNNAAYVGTGTIAAGVANTTVTMPNLGTVIVVNGTATNFNVGATDGSTPAPGTAKPLLTVNVQSAAVGSTNITTAGVAIGTNVYNNGIIEVRNTGGNVTVTPNAPQIINTTIWNGGEVDLYRGTSAESTLIKSGGLMVIRAIGATTNNTTVETGGILQVGYGAGVPGGLATNTTINGGLMTVLHFGSSASNDGRGSADGVTINNGGQLWVGAWKASGAYYVRNINIVSGEMDIWNNITGANDLSNITVGAGGVVRVLGTPEAFIPSVSYDTSGLMAGATITNLNLNGGKILLTNDASTPYALPAGTDPTKLVTSSTIIPTTFAAAKTLNIKGAFTGTGTVIMGADLAAGTGDHVMISGSAFGKLTISATSSSAPTAQTQYAFATMDASTAAASTRFIMAGSVWYNGASGPTSQDLAIGYGSDGSKSLGLGLPPPTPWYENAAGNAYAAAVTDWYADIQPLVNRMGELRMGQSAGLWVNGNGRKQQVRAVENYESDIWAYNVQFGADYAFKRERSTTYLGVVGSYTTANQDLNIYGSGNSITWGGGVYLTNFWHNGWYVDFSVKLQNQYQKTTLVTPITPAGENYSYHMPGTTYSLEIGKGFTAKSVYLEPQVQVTLLHTKAVDYSNSHADYHMDSSSPVAARAGLLISAPVDLNAGDVTAPLARPYARISVISISGVKNYITVDPIITDPYADPKPPHTWMTDASGFSIEGTIGINARFGNASQFYAELSTRWGGKVETPLSLTAGYRYNF